MGIEIERKFLARNESWRQLVTSSEDIRQGYLSSHENPVSIRVRIVDKTSAFLTLKARQQGYRRDEYEYAIPLDDGRDLIRSAIGVVIEKTRHTVMEGRTRWVIDEFAGANAGLVVAEVELPTENATFDRPSWLGPEVTSDGRYGNTSLAAKPFSSW